jgi:hypothetical protein
LKCRAPVALVPNISWSFSRSRLSLPPQSP